MTIETKGFIVTYYGDPCVGIYDQTWSIAGDFSFQNNDELQQFKDKLIESWEYCSDTPISVCTIEERNEKLKQEEEQYLKLKREFEG